MAVEAYTTDTEARQWARHYGENPSWYWDAQRRSHVLIADGVTTPGDMGVEIAAGRGDPAAVADYFVMAAQVLNVQATFAVNEARQRDIDDETFYSQADLVAAEAHQAATQAQLADLQRTAEDLHYTAEVERVAAEQAHDERMAELAERNDEVRRVYDLIFDREHYASFCEGDGAAEDNYSDQTWDHAERLVDSERTARSIKAGRDAAARAYPEPTPDEGKGDHELWARLHAAPPVVQDEFWLVHPRPRDPDITEAMLAGAYAAVGLDPAAMPANELVGADHSDQDYEADAVGDAHATALAALEGSLWEELGASPPEVRAAFWGARDAAGSHAGHAMSPAELGAAYLDARLPVPEHLGPVAAEDSDTAADRGAVAGVEGGGVATTHRAGHDRARTGGAMPAVTDRPRITRGEAFLIEDTMRAARRALRGLGWRGATPEWRIRAAYSETAPWRGRTAAEVLEEYGSFLDAWERVTTADPARSAAIATDRPRAMQAARQELLDRLGAELDATQVARHDATEHDDTAYQHWLGAQLEGLETAIVQEAHTAYPTARDPHVGEDEHAYAEHAGLPVPEHLRPVAADESDTAADRAVVAQGAASEVAADHADGAGDGRANPAADAWPRHDWTDDDGNHWWSGGSADATAETDVAGCDQSDPAYGAEREAGKSADDVLAELTADLDATPPGPYPGDEAYAAQILREALYDAGPPVAAEQAAADAAMCAREALADYDRDLNERTEHDQSAQGTHGCPADEERSPGQPSCAGAVAAAHEAVRSDAQRVTGELERDQPARQHADGRHSATHEGGHSDE